MTWEIRQGDCIEQMAGLEEASIDAVVCDPPYGLGFMGKAWDRPEGQASWTEAGGPLGVDHKTTTERGGAMMAGKYDLSLSGNQAFEAWCRAWAAEALRVLKPGGHLLAFGGTRTYHRLACAIEDAGFEIRDSLLWLYGSGFPKSLDVSKAIDKAERGVPQGGADPTSVNHGRFKTQASEGKRGEADPGRGFGAGPGQFMAEEGEADDRELVEAAQQWQGWGTALKPSHEPIVVARKPLVGTVAGNVLEHGTGALNIDGCRVEGAPPSVPQPDFTTASERATRLDATARNGEMSSAAGRWPANVVLSERAAEELDAQTGELTSGLIKAGSPRAGMGYHGALGDHVASDSYGDRGGASRFFYCAKTSRAERNAGLDGFDAKALNWSSGEQSPGTFQAEGTDRSARNHHPTVKPINLMRWLVRLVTPPGGLVLDPFLGSGTTGCAAALEGFDFIGIEREAEYVAIAETRMAFWAKHHGREVEDVLQLNAAHQRRRSEDEERGQSSLLDAIGEAA